jgi:hypothetical protein
MEKESDGTVIESGGVDELYQEINVDVAAHHQDANKIIICFNKQNEDKIESKIKASSSSCVKNVQF